MRSRKGQAAVEYLTTYGWVLLVVLVGISVLSYMGYLDPSQYVPERCNFGAQLICEDYRVDSNNSISIKMRNNFERAIEITNVTDVSKRYNYSSCNVPKEYAVSGIKDIKCNVGTNLVESQRYSFPIRIEFQRNESTAPSHNLTGEVYAKAE